MSSRVTGSAVFKVMALALAVGPVVFAAPAERKETQAQILEQDSFPCPNCFFGNAYYFFCFAADNQILLAQDKIPTVNYSDSGKNLLGKFHKSWRRPNPSAATTTLQYDNDHVWMLGENGQMVRLKRENSRDVFSNPQCRAAVKKDLTH